MKMVTAQVPHPIVQSQMFLPTLAPVSPYERAWTNEMGDECSLFAPRTPNHYDLLTLLGYLHVVQQRPVKVEVLDNERYCVTMPMSYLYEVLESKTNPERVTLWKSLKLLSRTSYSVRYKKPANHRNAIECVIAGLTGDLQLIRQRGRSGNVLIAKPLRGLVDDRMLTVNLTTLMALPPLSRVTAFFMQCREAKELTWLGWMQAVSGATYLKSFKRHFSKTLRDMEAVGFHVVVRGDSVLIRR